MGILHDRRMGNDKENQSEQTGGMRDSAGRCGCAQLYQGGGNAAGRFRYGGQHAADRSGRLPQRLEVGAAHRRDLFRVSDHYGYRQAHVLGPDARGLYRLAGV